MSGEPNTKVENRTESTDVDKTDETKVDEQETPDTETKETEVDLENDAVKAAIAAQVEATIGARVAREKGKIDAADAKAKAAEKKLAEAETKIATLTSDIDSRTTERDKALKDVIVYKLSHEEKVSPDLVNSLKGDNETELREAIQKFAKGGGAGSVNRIFTGKEASKTDDVDLSAIILEAARKHRA